MSEAFTAAVAPVARVPGIHAVLVVDPDAGVPVVAELAEGVSGRAVAALAASLFQRAAKGTEDAGFGGLQAVEMQASTGHVIVVGGGELLVVVLADRSAQLGRVRLEAAQAVEALS